MKKQVKIVLYVLIAISLIVCVSIGVSRIKVEQDYKDVQIAIRYNDVLNISQQTQRPIEEVLKEFKDLGATTLFVRENTVTPASRGELYNYKEQGEVTVFEGYLLKAFYPGLDDVKPQFNYVITNNKEVANTIYTNFSLKNVPVKMITDDQTYFIELSDFSSALVTTGVGFNYDDLNIAAGLGYTISPQIKSWTEPSEESISYVISELSRIDHLGTIYFADTDVPGTESEQFIQFISEHQLGFIEFFSEKQKGLAALAKAASENGKDFTVTRLHTLTDEESKKYTIPQMLDRFELALKERNLRTFLFKMPNTLNFPADEAFLKESITGFREIAEKSGFRITGELKNYNLPMNSFGLALLAGLGAVMVFILLFDKFGFTKTGYVLGIIGLVGYAGLLKLSPTMACKLMALFGAIMFPTYGVITAISDKPRNIKETIIVFLKTCVISYGGVLTIVGLLSRTSFGLGIDVFAGVKVAHIIPIAIILIYVIYIRHKLDINFYKEVLNHKISYLALFIVGAIGIALLIYTSRTGNGGTISSFELQFRQLLDNVLGVRPRTKEFLIGYPILICLLYYGYKEMYLPLLIFAAIGPISLVNTYAHIHTPILISVVRSAYGMLIGLIIGLIAIWGIKLIGKVTQKWLIQIK